MNYLYNPAVREATLQDVEALEALDAELFPHNCLGAKLMKNELMHGRCWVIEEQGEVVAYALMRHEAGLVDLMRLGVREAYRRRRYATALLDQVTRVGKNTMLTVLKDNTAAFRLYRRWGFQIVGDTGGGGWVMLRAGEKSPALRTLHT